ncbi:LOW QUALITY PROTEIN: uncharacterized protein LOC117324418 [Pecten maximus]|uniref:LOW QUALITY PROTEIN: uncharacterized protein LOC117324418 n=1 Tax=Pecten maximus TaxID=6579 RepID=UPI001458702F|nr:LOW QUALITY PROTEIN: uncharacterized protein LOC117324418 [Pecten maximus]
MATNKVTVEGTPSQPSLAKHDCAVLDLAFAMDCTGSMGQYIDTARTNIRAIVEQIVSSEKSDVHLALVEYRDHPPQDPSFVTRPHDFTASVSTMKSWLDGCSAQGGGDSPEAVADALHDMLKLSWRENATKICVLVSDAPPHGLAPHGDGFPNGCPAGLDPMDIVRQLAAKGITLYSVGCEPDINPYKEFFTAIAYLTGGQYIPLRGAKALTQVIIGGAQEEISLERWMAEVDEEVQREISMGNQINDDEMTRRVQAKMDSKGIRGKKLQRNNFDLEAASASSKKLAEFTNMEDVRSNFSASAMAPSMGSGMASAMAPSMGSGMASAMAPSMGSGMASAMAPSMGSGMARPRGSARARFAAVPSSAPMMSMGASGMATPPGMATGEADTWDTVESNISYGQAARMVQKSKSRNNYK